MTDELAVKQNEAAMMESVLLGGDLSKLTPAQRVSYYQKVCQSTGLNPLTRPFDYITLNGKLTLYARKDASEQLRRLHNVSVDDIEITENSESFIVKVKGHDATGRADVEVGIVKKSDMRGDAANAQMKAVTKAKRRLTLSICGLGFLDETEVVTIPDAQPVLVDAETGEIESPIQKAIRMYNELADRAKKLGIQADPYPANVTIEEMRELYKELQGYVKDAEEQAGAEQPA